jgi:LmbE family N-acetylglucosaminyl deacetylase
MRLLAPAPDRLGASPTESGGAPVGDPAAAPPPLRLGDRDVGPADRILLLVPHPDDEVLAAGLLVRRARRIGATVTVVVATDGEANVWVQRLAQRRLRVGPEDRRRFGESRADAARRALGRLGVGETEVRFLRLPDTGLSALLVDAGRTLVTTCARVMLAARATVLIVPAAADLHPDHAAIGVAVREALAETPVALRPALVLEYLVHERRSPSPSPSPLALHPTRVERAVRRRAIREHVAPMRVHARAFLARCERAERFRDVSSVAVAESPHLRARDRGDRVEIEAVLRARLLGGSPARLRLLVRRTDRSCSCLAVPLSRTSIASCVSSARVPRSVWDSAERVYAKVERRFGFYDDVGWTDVSRPLAATSAPVRRARLARDSRVTVGIVPCFDVATVCEDVVGRACSAFDRLILVDDGSTDDTSRVLRRVADGAGSRVEVLAFERNLGKGHALLAGFRRALEGPRFDVLVTLDSDGQHRPEDAGRLVARCAGGTSLVIGARCVARAPWRSRIGNRCTSALLRRLHPRCPEDTQSGFRAHARAFVEEVVDAVAPGRYETEMRILLLALARGRGVASVRIPTLYQPGNPTSHFRALSDSVRVWRPLLADLRAAALRRRSDE